MIYACSEKCFRQESNVCAKAQNHKRLASLRPESQDFSGGTMDKNLPANAGDLGSIPDPGRSHMPQSS